MNHEAATHTSRRSNAPERKPRSSRHSQACLNDVSSSAANVASEVSTFSAIRADVCPGPLGLRLVAGLTRLALGWIFLWAFLDKAFGLGHETAGKDAWIHGGSPTFGFLSFAATGPFKGMYHSIAGTPWADWLFMLGLLGTGAALTLGLFVNLAASSGALMLLLMWTVVLPPQNNPIIDDHIVYALVLVALAFLHAGRWFGLGSAWERTRIVQKWPALR